MGTQFLPPFAGFTGGVQGVPFFPPRIPPFGPQRPNLPGGFPGDVQGVPFGIQRPNLQNLLQGADTDADGNISQAEFLAFTPQPPVINGQQPSPPTDEMKQAMFTRLDTNGDGSISSDELLNARPPRPPFAGFPGGVQGSPFQGVPFGIQRPNLQNLLQGADTDADGNISQAEFLAFTPQPPVINGQQLPAPTDEMKQAMFTRLDANGDGSISSDELLNARPPRPPFAGFPGGVQGSPFQGVPFGIQRPNLQNLLQGADTDADGNISQAEFLAFTPQPPVINGQQPSPPTDEMKQAMFTRLDTNGDGSISSDELLNARPPRPPFAGFPGGVQGSPFQGTPFGIQRPNLQNLLQGADTDADGNISQAEFLAFTPQPPAINGQQPPAPTDEMKQAMFTRLDANGDGSISSDELLNARPPRPPFTGFPGSVQGSPFQGVTGTFPGNGNSGFSRLISLLQTLLGSSGT